MGGLEADDIWLAEDHLLVVRGGAFDKKQPQGAVWPPIDDYEAPLRQVKIPAQPAVPPPFPVQLKPDGPIEFIGYNGSRVVALQPPGAASPGQGSFAPVFGTQKPLAGVGYNPGQIPHYLTPYPRNLTSGETPFPIPPFPFPPTGPYRPLNDSSLADNNVTDLYDEDDPSVYYPPPYSFYYPIDESKLARAGPLVPGIILPPPPDFFAPLEEDTITRNDSTTHKPTEPPRTEPPISANFPNTYLPVPAPAPAPVSVPNKYHKIPHSYDNIVPILPEVSKPHDFYYYNPQNPKHVQINSPGGVKLKTTLRPVPQIGKLKPVYDYYEVNTVTPPVNSFKVYGPPPYPDQHPIVRPDFGRTYVSSTAVPLRSFYEVRQQEVPRPKIRPQYYEGTNKPSASYFFYEEPPSEPHVSDGYYDKRYYNSPQEHQQFVYNAYGLNQLPNRQHEQQYLYNGNPPENVRPIYYRIPKPIYRPTSHRQSFQQQVEEIQKTLHYYTTQSPRYIYRNIDENAARYNQILPAKQSGTPKPVYQYSFNAVGYEDGQKSFTASQIQDPNNEPFRPMISYDHVPLVSDNQNAKKQYPPVTSETPLESKFIPHGKQQRYETVTPSTILKPQYSIRKPPSHNSISTTPNPRYNTANPLNSNYYTQHEEGLFDEITKKYFTIFGQKLYNSKGSNELGVTEALRAGPVTTPIPPNDWLPSYSVQESREVYSEQKRKNTISNSANKNGLRNQQPNRSFQNQPSHSSLESDTLVNYLRPRPEYNVESELISNNSARKNQGYNSIRPKELQQLVSVPQREQLPKSLARDELVNYRNPRPPLNPETEFIPISSKRRPEVVSYDLPGDSAHVYFLTPQRRGGYIANQQTKVAEPIK